MSTTTSPAVVAVECLCPFCGTFNAGVGQPCPSCRTEDTTAARAAARKRVGPWFVLNNRNPAAPGISFTALLGMIRQGTVSDRSVVRGPATGQLWRLAGKVRGLSREFGLCYGCGGELAVADPLCPHCQRPQSLPADVDAAPAEPTGFVPRDRGDRLPPKQDLLTPRDVAKAFSIGFNPAGADLQPASLDELLPPARPAGIPVSPMLIAGAFSAVVAIVSVGWLVSRLTSHRPTAPSGTVAMVDDGPQAAVAIAPPSPLPHRAIEQAPPSYARPAMLVHRTPVEEPAPAGANESIADEPSDDNAAHLMTAALAAEARGDYAAAVKQYEKIETLSSDEWPAGFRDRLKLARKAARGDD